MDKTCVQTFDDNEADSAVCRRDNLGGHLLLPQWNSQPDHYGPMDSATRWNNSPVQTKIPVPSIPGYQDEIRHITYNLTEKREL